MKNGLSIVLATHNEAENLSRCLESVEKIADEIIIADGDSTDKTVEIAESFHARVIKTTNKQNFHINKQLAMDKAQYNLVLQLDADEAVDEELGNFIKALKKNAAHNIENLPAAWWIRRKNFFMGKFLSKGGQYPDPVIRLYQNGQAHLPQKDVHEQMVVDGDIAWAEGHLLHYANPSFQHYLKHSFDRYSSFKAQQWFDDSLKPSLFLTIKYGLWMPLYTFILIYVRHKGFVDGVPGFVFALFSGLHYPVAYLKLHELIYANSTS